MATSVNQNIHCFLAGGFNVVRKISVLFQSYSIFLVSEDDILYYFYTLITAKKSVTPTVLFTPHIFCLYVRHMKPEGRGFESRWCHWKFLVS
jgi:hypothetical protein